MTLTTFQVFLFSGQRTTAPQLGSYTVLPGVQICQTGRSDALDDLAFLAGRELDGMAKSSI
jgi:hypothetical protein